MTNMQHVLAIFAIASFCSNALAVTDVCDAYGAFNSEEDLTSPDFGAQGGQKYDYAGKGIASDPSMSTWMRHQTS